MSETLTTKQEFAKDDIKVAKALPEHAEIICDIRDRCWLKTNPNPSLGITYEDILLNAKGPDGIFLERRIAWFKNKLAMRERLDGATYIAKVNGQVVGFVDPSIEDGRRRIGALYVDPEFHKLGVGGELMKKALAWHGRQEDIFLEVISYNDNAIKFYEKFGFIKTDAVVPEQKGRPSYLKKIPKTEMVLKRS